MPALLIRPAEVADAGEIITVQRAAFVVEAQRNNAVLIPPLTETVADAAAAVLDPATTVLVALRRTPRGERLVGSGRLRVVGGVGEVGRLSAAPDQQSTGVGSAVLQRLHDLTAPVRCFELVTGGSSVANHRWYAGHGYEQVATSLDPVGVPLVRMRRPALRPGAARPRAAAYVTRPTDGGRQVLVLDQADDQADDPSPGTQVPAGGIRAGESVAQAARREVQEETGVSATRFVGLLGYSDRPGARRTSRSSSPPRHRSNGSTGCRVTASTPGCASPAAGSIWTS